MQRKAVLVTSPKQAVRLTQCGDCTVSRETRKELQVNALQLLPDMMGIAAPSE